MGGGQGHRALVGSKRKRFSAEHAAAAARHLEQCIKDKKEPDLELLAAETGRSIDAVRSRLKDPSKGLSLLYANAIAAAAMQKREAAAAAAAAGAARAAARKKRRCGLSLQSEHACSAIWL
jgi:hypothetical protein